MASSKLVDKTYKPIWEELVSLHAMLRLYEQLFGPPEHKPLLDASAPAAFGIIQKALSDQMILLFTRLIDKRRDALKLRTLVDSIDGRRHGDLKKSLTAKISLLEEQLAQMRNDRHTRVAHTNKAIALEKGLSKSPLIQKARVDEIVTTLDEFMQEFEQKVYRKQTAYKEVIMEGDGRTLICLLKKARHWNELLREGKVELGEWDNE